MYIIDPIQHGTICIQLEMHSQVQIQTPNVAVLFKCLQSNIGTWVEHLCILKSSYGLDHCQLQILWQSAGYSIGVDDICGEAYTKHKGEELGVHTMFTTIFRYKCGRKLRTIVVCSMVWAALARVMWQEASLVPRPRPAFRHLQYGKVGGAWV